jgi:hypothetical protein
MNALFGNVKVIASFFLIGPVSYPVDEGVVEFTKHEATQLP